MKLIERAVLESLAKAKGPLDGHTLAEAACIPYSSLMSVLSTLELRGLAEVTREEVQKVELTAEGKSYAQYGLPERRLVDALGKTPLELQKAFEKTGLNEQNERQIALVWAKKNGWVEITQGKIKALTAFESSVESGLKNPKIANADSLKVLVERKLAVVHEGKTVSVKLTSKGKASLKDDCVFVSQLTPEMLKTGSWKNAKFAPYDVKTVIAPVQAGAKHPYQEFLRKMREKLVGLGFREVNGSLVEMEFWNMDALFMAQDHPAREIHDVFFVESDLIGSLHQKELIERVKRSHEEGLEGSKGWRYTWSPEISARLIARSHDTGISARELYHSKEFPDKVFFIAHVFRPDEIDWKHFIEFSQLGGYVAGSINFNDLLGYLKTFAFEVFKAEEVKFVPSYFPFTEPSVELYAKIPGRGWAEVGGAGLFRPEMLSALGVDVPVIAWGLGIDRLAMLSLGITDIRDLFSSDLAFLRNKA